MAGKYLLKLSFVHYLLLLMLVLILSTSCIGKIAERVVDDTMNRQLTRTVKVKVPNIDQIYNCMRTPEGPCDSCSENFNKAAPASLLKDEMLTYVPARNATDQENFKYVTKSLSVLYDYLSSNSQVTKSLGEKKIKFTDTQLNGFVRYWQNNQKNPRELLSFDFAKDEQFNSEITELIESYYLSYFRSGNFASVEVDLAELEAQLKKKLVDKFPGIKIPASGTAELYSLIKEYLGVDIKSIRQKCGASEKQFVQVEEKQCFVFGKVSDEAFISRSGEKYQFPPIDVKVSITAEKPVSFSDVDYTAVGSDFVRVFVEAVGDGLAQLPTVEGATGSKTSSDGETAVLKVFDKNEYIIDKTVWTAWANTDIDDKEDAKYCIDDKYFGIVNDIANSFDGASSTAVGQLIRGAGPFSLNNEALAKLLETLVGAVVRKVAEKAAWCTLACIKVSNAFDGNKGETIDSLFVMENLGLNLSAANLKDAKLSHGADNEIEIEFVYSSDPND